MSFSHWSAETDPQRPSKIFMYTLAYDPKQGNGAAHLWCHRKHRRCNEGPEEGLIYSLGLCDFFFFFWRTHAAANAGQRDDAATSAGGLVTGLCGQEISVSY